MYQALYRKYRPVDFADVVGQKIIVKTLENAVLNNKIVHAYLFTGPRGTGKTSIAKIYAKTINCQNLNGFLPCNKCVSCTQINNKQNVDIIEIDAASNNGVDEIREIKNKVNLVPSISKYKVYIIDEVHMLTTGAFNALLKTLEEPPNHVIFILATTEPQKIPATILSRCQRYDFNKLSIIEIFDRLKKICKLEKISIEDDAIKEIARISDGGMRDSISTLDQVISFNNEHITIDDVHMVNGTLTQNDLKEFVLYILSKNIEKTFDLLDKYNNAGKDLSKLIDEMILFLRNTILFYTVPNYMKKNNIDVSPYMNFKKIVDIPSIYLIINSLNDVSYKMKQSSSPKILFEVELLKIFSSQQQTNISQEINIDKKIESNTKNDNINKNNNIENNKKSKENKEKYNLILSELKSTRISNTLSLLDKKNIIIIRQLFLKLNSLILDKKVGKVASLLLDSQIKAASKNNLIFMFNQSYDSLLFNDNILLIEEILKKYLKIDYKVISVDNNEWNFIKNDFNNKKKVYNYIDEQIDFNELCNLKKIVKPKDELSDLFDDIVEYTKEEII